jgi:hypothetical protein
VQGSQTTIASALKSCPAILESWLCNRLYLFESYELCLQDFLVWLVSRFPSALHEINKVIKEECAGDLMPSRRVGRGESGKDVASMRFGCEISIF